MQVRPCVRRFPMLLLLPAKLYQRRVFSQPNRTINANDTASCVPNFDQFPIRHFPLLFRCCGFEWIYMWDTHTTRWSNTANCKSARDSAPNVYGRDDKIATINSRLICVCALDLPVDWFNLCAEIARNIVFHPTQLLYGYKKNNDTVKWNQSINHIRFIEIIYNWLYIAI